MSIVTWSKDYEVKIDEIDQQHRKLFSMINELFASMKEGRTEASIVETVNGMLDYTQYHFKTEEDYMIKFKYPGYKRHKKEHDKFVNEVLEFYNKLQKGEQGVTLEVLVFLKDWIINHINGIDRKYVGLFKEKGL